LLLTPAIDTVPVALPDSGSDFDDSALTPTVPVAVPASGSALLDVALTSIVIVAEPLNGRDCELEAETPPDDAPLRRIKRDI